MIYRYCGKVTEYERGTRLFLRYVKAKHPAGFLQKQAGKYLNDKKEERI